MMSERSREVESIDGATLMLGKKIAGRKLYSVLVAAPTGDVLNVAVWGQTPIAAEARASRAGFIVLPRERRGKGAGAVVGAIQAMRAEAAA